MLSQLEKAERDLREFLEKHPEFKEYQEEIERRLSKEPSIEGRMNILRFMMSERLDALKVEMCKLQNVTEGVKKGLERRMKEIENQNT